MAHASRRRGSDILRAAGRIRRQVKTRVVHDALQLREHVTGDKILAHRHDGIGLKAMLLRASTGNANSEAPAKIDRSMFIAPSHTGR